MILITGGAGFIGSHFVNDWLSRGNEPVINVDKLTYAGNLNNLADLQGNSRHCFVREDICNAEGIASLLTEYRPRAIVHLAAETHVDRSIATPDAFIDTNVQGTFTLLEAARQYWNCLPQDQRKDFRFLHVSTDEVYGSLEKNAPAFTEMSQYAPNSPYSASKAGADHLVRAYYHTYGFPVLTTNSSNNYGPRHFPEKLIPKLIEHALDGKSLPLYGDGRHVRDWMYVGDHCEALRRVLANGRVGAVYNIGAENQRTNLDVANTICSLLDDLAPRRHGSYHDQIAFVADRPGHDRRYAIDASLIRNELGWKPSQSFEEGLKKTVEWHLERRFNHMKSDTGVQQQEPDTGYGGQVSRGDVTSGDA